MTSKTSALGNAKLVNFLNKIHASLNHSRFIFYIIGELFSLRVYKEDEKIFFLGPVGTNSYIYFHPIIKDNMVSSIRLWLGEIDKDNSTIYEFSGFLLTNPFCLKYH